MLLGDDTETYYGQMRNISRSVITGIACVVSSSPKYSKYGGREEDLPPALFSNGIKTKKKNFRL
jgi:hypothetical protein